MSERPPPYRRPVLPLERGRSEEASAGRWASAGFEFALAVLLFFFAGRWLDGRLGTAPLWTAVGSLLGIAAGMYMLVRGLLKGPPPPPPGGEPPRNAR